MSRSRTLTALAGVAGSLALSAILYVYTGSVLFFLFVPFLPLLFVRRDGSESSEDAEPVRECSRCDFETRNPGFEYCPRDGSRLYERR